MSTAPEADNTAAAAATAVTDNHATDRPCGRDPVGNYNPIPSVTIQQKIRAQVASSSSGTTTTTHSNWMDHVVMIDDGDNDNDAPTSSSVIADDSLTTPNNISYAAAAPANDEDDAIFASAMQSIAACTTIHDFIHVYESTAYQTSIERLRSSYSQGDDNSKDNNSNKDRFAEAFAKAWALRMRRPDTATTTDRRINHDRKLLLQLLYVLCDCCWPKQQLEQQHQPEPTVSTTDIVHHFATDRIQTILFLALPLDRAQALYKMEYNRFGDTSDAKKQYGMYWVAQQHVDRAPMWRHLLASFTTHTCRPTMNKRLIYLLELDELGLRQIPSINLWLQPRVIPPADDDA